MATIITLIAAVLLLAIMAGGRLFALINQRENVIVSFVKKGDKYINLLRNKYSENKKHLTVTGLGKLTLKTIDKTKKKAVAVKRRFDHQQSHFFIKRDNQVSNRHPSSFFLKNIVEHKKNIEGQGEIHE